MCYGGMKCKGMLSRPFQVEVLTAVVLKKDKLLILLRDTYIEKSNMRGWLSVLTATENIHKV